MQYTPRDILNYVYEKELDTQFLLATANHVQDFSIGEITDKKIEKRGEDFYLVSKSYHLDIKITDDEVLTAAINGLYISAFISRKDDNYRVHFLVHRGGHRLRPGDRGGALDDHGGHPGGRGLLRRHGL